MSGAPQHTDTPSISWAARAALALIRLYQLTLAQYLGGRCRFHPTCSQYAIDAFTLHPPWRALWLTARRLSRCHPLGGHGIDPVPEPRRKP